jgi:hypothetical protein
MEILEAGLSKKTPLIGLYGASGVGKSTLASGAISPVFIDVENGLSQIAVPRVPIKTSVELMQAIAICAKSRDHKTIVIDTVDAIEDILSGELCKANSWTSLADAGYGKGYAALKQKWLELLPLFLKCANEYKKTVILIGHDSFRRVDDPLNESYDKVVLKLNQHVAGLLFQYSDAFLYMRMDETITKDKNGNNKILSDGSRKILTSSTPACMAKNRYNLPTEMSVSKTFFADLQRKILGE